MLEFVFGPSSTDGAPLLRLQRRRPQRSREESDA